MPSLHRLLVRVPRINDLRFREVKAVHESAVMVGWDFSLLDGRLTSDEEPWKFDSDCIEAMPTSGVVVDLRTGGERLSKLVTDPSVRHKNLTVAATEGWEPDVEVARMDQRIW